MLETAIILGVLTTIVMVSMVGLRSVDRRYRRREQRAYLTGPLRRQLRRFKTGPADKVIPPRQDPRLESESKGGQQTVTIEPMAPIGLLTYQGDTPSSTISG